MSDYTETSPLFSHKELRHVMHVRKTQSNQDTHVIRETLHFTDGTAVNSTRAVLNYKRPFYVTLPNHRNYLQHKEREPLDRLSKHESTQSEMSYNIARALGQRTSYGSVRQMCNSPYVFGAASPSTTLIRRMYKKAWPNPPTPLNYLAYDLETCVFDEYGTIIIASIAFKDVVRVFIRASFVEGIPDAVEKLHALAPILYEKHHYTEIMKGCEVEFLILPDEITVIQQLARGIREADPDVIAAWNHDFDVNKIIKRCESLGLNGAALFSAPEVPPPSQRFEFIEGKRSKITVDGNYRPLAPSEQWHNVRCTSGYLWLDAMCVYRRLRSQNAALTSFGLDNVMNIHLGVGKLETPETEGMDGLSRHQYMQTHDKLTYCIYAILDVRLMVMLERKTKDITLRLPTELAGSDFFDTPSSSQRTVDMFAEACEEDGYVLGTVGSDADAFPEEVLPLSGWPLTLPNDLNAQPGICCLKDYPYYATNIFTCVMTSDLTSAYPTLISCMGISKETTKHEFIRMEGAHCSPKEILMQNMNVFGGEANAIDYCRAIYGWPSLEDMDKLIAATPTAI